MPRFPSFIGASNTPQSVIHDAEGGATADPDAVTPS
jgi:hypothetical protein